MSKEVLEAVPIGMALGMLTHLCGLSNPQVIRGQFIFDKHVMLKTFLGGVTGSALSFAILSLINPDEFAKKRAAKGYGDKGAITAAMGGFLQGAGMAISASCPGMIYAQLGAGVRTTPIVYLGGLCGASLYSYLHPRLKQYMELDFSRTLKDRLPSMHLEEQYHGRFIPLTLAVAAVMLSAALALEAISPWRAELKTLRNAPDESKQIMPIAAGLLLGLLQLPIYFLLNSFLGTSSSYTVITSQALRLLPEDACAAFPYAKGYLRSSARWQVGLVLGIAIGAALVSGYANALVDSLSNGNGIVPSETASVSPKEAFLGGMLLIFGARLAGGCTSGHGISGLPSLHVISWITMAFMALGAMVTGGMLSTFVMSKPDYLLQT